MNHKILIVDDEPANLRLIERLLRRKYDVITASSGKEGLELLQRHDVALIISDQRMPEMTGVEFLKHAAEMRKQTVRIILTGYTDVNALVEAINSGAIYKYVTKPWMNEDLIQTVKRGIETYESNKQLHCLTSNNHRLSKELKTAQDIFVQLALKALGARDKQKLEHARRSSAYAVALGERLLCLDQNELDHLELAARLHSIGIIGLHSDIFNNKTETSKEEYLINLEQTENLMAEFPEMEDIAVAIRHHRENFDGSGYPAGLSGQQIPLFSRVIAVAAAYAEIVGQPAVSHDEALGKLLKESGKRFDPVVINALQQINAEINAPQMVGV